MAFPFQLMLRLPPSLRCQAIAPYLARINGRQIQTVSRRSFTSSPIRLQQAVRPPPKPRSVRKSSQPSETPTAAAPPPRPNLLVYLTSNLAQHPTLLLYRAPSHTSYIVTCYASGLLFTISAFFQAKSVSSAVDINPYLQNFLGGMSIIYAAAAAFFFISPQKLIRTISLTRRGKELYLQFDMLSPFLRKKPSPRIMAPLGSVYLSSRVQSMKDLNFYSIPREQVAEFTVSEPMQAKSGALAALIGDVRKMFWRDGIAYVRIPEQGVFKLDLQGCEVLQSGTVLQEVMEVDAGRVFQGGIVARLRRGMGR